MTTGRTSRQRTIQATGRPNCAPGRSQSAAGGEDGGGRSAAGSSGAGSGASGPNPSRPTTTNAAHARMPSSARAAAIVSGVTASDPSLNWLLARFVPIASRATIPPSATGPPIAKRISSIDQRTGCMTLATTAITVSATMIATNGRLPKPVPAGTLIAR